MQKKYRFLAGQSWQTLSLGMLCAIGAFAMGIETAGDVHPFAKSQAALEAFMDTGYELRGDVNGNGTIDSEDAYLLYQFTQGLETPTAQQLRAGDTDHDLQLTGKDLGFVLRHLSQQ